MNKFLLIVTDGARPQIAGIQYLLNSLFLDAASRLTGWSVGILTPKRAQAEALTGNGFPGAEVFSLPLGQYVDKYYIKFLLPEFIAAHCHEDDLILYLDYDHICWGDFQLPVLAQNTIYLSSEIHPLEKILTRSIPESKLLLDQLSLHYNTSLIFTTAGLLMHMATRWAGCYRELRPYISCRYLEEVAFSLAALQCCISLRPVQATIQSNWQNIHPHAGLFHYGGEHRYSSVIKGFLAANNMADRPLGNNTPEHCRQKEIFEKICTAFRQYQPVN